MENPAASDSDRPPAVQRYRDAVATVPPDETPAATVRFVVLDCEMTGTNAARDRLISMGAIVVQDGEIRLEDQFEVLLRVSHNTAAVVVHGITAEEAAATGVSEAEALRRFLKFLGGGVVVGHHIGFDLEVISRACQRCFGVEVTNRWIDTMELTLHLADAGAIEAVYAAAGLTGPPFRDFTLDGLCRLFRIEPHDRHTATGDAFITAQILLQLLRLAARHGRTTLGALAERWIDPRAEPAD